MTIKRIGILYHPLIEAAGRLARSLEDFLVAKGISIWLGSSWEVEKARARLPGTDLLLTVGGDGTILRAAQVVIGESTPIVGINLGHLGFMTELGAAEAIGELPAIVIGRGWLDERAMLEARLTVNGEEKAFHALNDVVVARGAIARVVHIETLVDGVKFTDYASDGVITATATGATGYSLAAGGPILHPAARDFLLLPVLPHLCLGYTLVLPAKSVVEFRLSTSHAATLSIDGQTNLSIPSGTSIIVRESPYRARFLRIHPETSFYSTLEQKLRGRGNASSGSES